MDSSQPMNPDGTIPVLEETASIGKRTVTTGVLRVEKKVHAQDYLVSDVLQHHTASVEHVSKGTQVDPANPPQVRTEQGVTIIPILEEVLVVEKRLMLKEELHVRQQVEEVRATEKVTLRSEAIVLKRSEATPEQK